MSVTCVTREGGYLFPDSFSKSYNRKRKARIFVQSLEFHCSVTPVAWTKVIVKKATVEQKKVGNGVVYIFAADSVNKAQACHECLSNKQNQLVIPKHNIKQCRL